MRLRSILLAGALCVVTLFAYSRHSSISSLSITPTVSFLSPGCTEQLDLTITGTGNYSGAARWTTSGGHVSSAGIFTAPAAVGTYYVTAQSVQDHTKHMTVTVVVSVVGSVTVLPQTVTVAPGDQIQFTATVQ